MISLLKQKNIPEQLEALQASRQLRQSTFRDMVFGSSTHEKER
jgi:hypothetical protein